MRRYVVSYVAYQQCERGDDGGYDGWQSFYSHIIVFTGKSDAVKLAEILKKDKFKKDVFVSEEIT